MRPPTLPRRCSGPASLRVLVAVGCLLGTVALAGPTPPSGAAPPPPPTPVRHVHDPAIVREGAWWYLYATGEGLPVRRSADLVTWEDLGPAIPTPPAWWSTVRAGATDAWAPHLVEAPGGGWRLYYAVSTFFTTDSAIGLATSPTLDPGDPAYGWVDHGVVVRSHPGDRTNAIDAAVAEEGGQPWLVWGSFQDGIVAQALDPTTGLLADPSADPTPLARRPGPNSAIEAAEVRFVDGWWWLFVSFDLCCRADATYHVRAGRSRTLLGPYVDLDGRPMLEGGGTAVVAGHGDVRGPGHQHVMVDGDEVLLAHHWYDAAAGGTPTLAISALAWVDGFPLAAPAGASPEVVAPTADRLVGTWRLERQHRSSPGTGELVLLDGGRVAGGGRWRVDGTVVRVELGGPGCTPSGATLDVVVLAGGTVVGRSETGWPVRAERTSTAGADPCPAPTSTTTTATGSPAPASAAAATGSTPVAQAVRAAPALTG